MAFLNQSGELNGLTTRDIISIFIISNTNPRFVSLSNKDEEFE
jgi:hypothetical protein